MRSPSFSRTTWHLEVATMLLFGLGLVGWFGWSKEKDAQITLANGIEYRKGQVQSTLPFLYHDHGLSTAILHTVYRNNFNPYREP
jgi:hypothetical protein